MTNRRVLVDPAVLEIRVLGGLEVYRGGRTGHPARQRPGKGRTVLAILAVAGGSSVTVDRVVDALWTHPPRHAPQNVATLVSRLRTDLGRSAILGGPTGYRLAPTVGVDLHHAADLVDRAGVDRADTALTCAVAALRLLSADPVLPEYPDAEWARPARDWHAGLLRRARTIAARSAVAAGHLDLAAATAQAAIRDDPLDEGACRALMAAHLAANEPVRAVRAYHRLRTALDHELGLHPTPATQRLLVDILRYGREAPWTPST
jgi:DNA-binding SARP family transcriptional activator